MPRESSFQSKLREKLEQRFPGCVIFKTDPTQQQGAPDLLILYKNHWALLECKKSRSEPHRPNQDYYVEKYNNMSFSAFIFPENEMEVLDALQRSFES